LLKVFQDFEIQRIYPLNQSFDHTFHEAISQVVDNEKEPNTIINVIQAGYAIRDRLLKPAVVIVTKNE
jgi:molecular chaperone GrpE